MQPVVTMPTPLVGVSWLNEHRDHPNVVVIDCRFALSNPHHGFQVYHQGHLPGAHYLSLDENLSGPVQPHGGRHPLPDIEQFVVTLETLGITSEPATAVVVYDATKGAFAARLWWLLQYLGHKNVALLEGGFPAWQAAQLPLEQDPPALPVRGKFTPQVQASWVVNRDYVMQHNDKPGIQLVDARSPERFSGKQEPIDPVPGSIPGAMNVFWQSNLDEQGYFKTSAELQSLWNQLPPADDLVAYCGSGVTACVNILAQVIMERPIPKLYVGGWSDWCSYSISGQ